MPTAIIFIFKKRSDSHKSLPPKLKFNTKKLFLTLRCLVSLQ